MEHRKIKVNNQEEDVSLLGFGCMRFPTKDGEIDEKKSLEMMKYALDNGVNYIDTAYPYHGGKSELFVGKAIKELKLDRESFYLADKLPLWECKTKEDVDKVFHEQLEKVGVEYFDFYLVHAVNEARLEKAEKLDLMKKLEQYKAEGKIKNIGFSFHDDLKTFKKWVNFYDKWDFCQIQLNYMDINHQQGMTGYSILTEKGIPVVIMEPVKGGNLVNFNDDIKDIFYNYDDKVSIASWAFRWVGSLENVKVILSGMTTLDQVKDNVKTFTNFKPLNQDEQALIKKVRSEVKSLTEVACTQCDYCMPCPHGVNIPGNFKLFNSHVMYQNDKHTKWAYGNLEKKDADASVCISCEECVPKCPQNIDIPRELARFERYLEENGLQQ
ncbi:MAG: aldo/keto reductase [Candidatus Izimaplasma sp.]|nr:aldo/keto reductase [Candidatus Izimaplasma bacterium]